MFNMAPKSKRTARPEEAESTSLPGKRKKIEVEDDSSSSFSNESDSDQLDASEEEDITNEEINVDFEGKNIVEEDFHGIKLLLQRLLLTISINISELTDIIIAQQGIGSTLKVADDDEGTVYGITTILDCDKNKEKDCVINLRKSLKEKCKKSSPSHQKELSRCFEKSVCFLVNERFINIPEDVAAPMLSSLRSEIEEAKDEGEVSSFDYYLMIIKGVKPANTKNSSPHNEGETSSPSSSKKKKMKKKRAESDVQMQFTNQEDELFYKSATLSFDYCVTNATGFAVSGEWEFGDVAMDTYRTVVIIESSKFNSIVDKIQRL